MPNLQQLIAQLVAARAKATPGEWHRIDPPWGDSSMVHAGPSDDPHSATHYICESVYRDDECTEESHVAEDMAFIALAANLIPALADALASDADKNAEIERLQARLTAAEGLAEACLAWKQHLVATFPPYPKGESPSERIYAALAKWDAARPAPRVYTKSEVAKLCKVAPRTVSKWYDAGRLKGYRIPGTQEVRIPAEYLLKFMYDHGMSSADVKAEIAAADHAANPIDLDPRDVTGENA